MDTNLSIVINQIIQANNDRRTRLFDVQVQAGRKQDSLSGEVLDEATLEKHASDLINEFESELK